MVVVHRHFAHERSLYRTQTRALDRKKRIREEGRFVYRHFYAYYRRRRRTSIKPQDETGIIIFKFFFFLIKNLKSYLYDRFI